MQSRKKYRKTQHSSTKFTPMQLFLEKNEGFVQYNSTEKILKESQRSKQVVYIGL